MSNNESEAEPTTLANTGSSHAKLKKKKSLLKNITGFVTGESRRKKRKERKLAQAAAAAANNNDDNRSDDGEESTVYGVVVGEDNSVGTGISSPKRKGVSPESAPGGQKNGISADNKQSTTNILKVILLLMDPISRRFELLQLDFDSLKALVSDILAQIPISVTEAVIREQKYVGICGIEAVELSPNKLLSDYCYGNEVLLAMPVNTTPKECVRFARPILSDEQVVSMLTSSGIDVSAWKISRKSKKSKTNGTESETAGHSVIISATTPREKSYQEKRSLSTTTPDVKVDKMQSPYGILRRIITGVFVLFFLSVAAHVFASMPMVPTIGSSYGAVTTGIRLSKCGGLRYKFVTACEEEFMNIRNEGKVVYYDEEKDIAWKIQGDDCKRGDESCIPGIQVTEHKVDKNQNNKQVKNIGINIPLLTSTTWPFIKQKNEMKQQKQRAWLSITLNTER